MRKAIARPVTVTIREATEGNHAEFVVAFDDNVEGVHATPAQDRTAREHLELALAAGDEDILAFPRSLDPRRLHAESVVAELRRMGYVRVDLFDQRRHPPVMPFAMVVREVWIATEEERARRRVGVGAERVEDRGPVQLVGDAARIPVLGSARVAAGDGGQVNEVEIVLVDAAARGAEWQPGDAVAVVVTGACSLAAPLRLLQP